MDEIVQEIEKRVAAAHRRLLVRQWAGRLAVCLTITYSLALAAILLPKLFPLPSLPSSWASGWLLAAGVFGLLAATVWTAVRPKSRLEAAVEIDHRYELRERIASSLTLSESDLSTEAGAAVARDAAAAIARIEVAERITLGIDRAVLRPLAPALAALLIALLVGNRVAEATVEKATQEQVVAKQVKEAVEKTRKQLRKKRQDAEKQGLADASALLKKIEEGAAELSKRDPKQVSKAAVQLNDLAKQLQQRKQKLGSGKELRNQLNRMKDLGRGPADKAADAMKKGDWKQAMKEIEKLRQQIAGGKASAEQKKQLVKQLGNMQQKLAEAAQQQQAQKRELQRQLAEAQRKGDLQQAGKLQQKLDQMGQQAPQMKQMQQMAQQMKQAQDALQQGDAQKAANAMEQMAQQMQQMAQDAQEMEMLDAAMTDIQLAKEGMMGDPQMAQAMAQAGGKPNEGKPGPGNGRGRGSGDRPDEKNDVAFRDSQVKQQVGRGASTFGGLVKGPSIKGEVAESIKTQLNADSAEPADPLTSERLPRSRREHAEAYFRALREKL